MDETSKLNLRPLLVALAIMAVAATIWAATALAAGGPSSSNGSADASPGLNIQAQNEGPARGDRNCPKDGGGGGGGGGGSDPGSGGSGSSDL